jgi:hypothetical protein
MPMNDAQIRAVIEQQLADCPGAFYGAAQTAQPNANGKAALKILNQAAVDDIETAAHAEEDSDGSTH